VRIDGTSGTDPRKISQGAACQSESQRPTRHDAPDAATTDPLIGYLHKMYAPRAAGTAEVNQQAIAAARRLLESGQLDTPQAIRRAAEAILTRGI